MSTKTESAIPYGVPSSTDFHLIGLGFTNN